MDTDAISRLEICYTFVQQLVDDLPETTLNRFLQGTEDDQGRVMRELVDTTYEILYGQNHQGQLFHGRYIDGLSESLEEKMRCDNLNYFILSVMPGFEMNWHHVEWGDVVQNYMYFNIIAARDHGKSFFFSNAYPCWKMYRYKPAGPQVRADYTLSQLGYLFSFSLQQAKDLLEIIKNTIEANDILRERLMPVQNAKENWSKAKIIARNGAQLRVRGMGNAVRGAHPGYIVVDDPLKDNAMYSSLQREKTIEYFQSVIMNMIVPGGQVGVVGTPFHRDDLYASLKKDRDIWHVREYPAVFPDGRLLWPRRHSLTSLQRKRKSQGSLRFSRENLCRPVSSDSSIFPYEILQRSIHRMEEYQLVKSIENFPVKFERVVVGTDFAISASVGADYSVFVVFGIDVQGIMWLLHFRRGKGWSYAEQKSMLRSMYTNFKPDVMFLEQNQFQVVFVEELASEGLPVYGHHTGVNKHDLKKGLPGLALLFEQGRIKIPYGDEHSKQVADLIFSEFSSITFTGKGLESVDQHDDIPHAFWQAASAANWQGSRFIMDFA